MPRPRFQTDLLNVVRERGASLGSLATANIGSLVPLSSPLTMPHTSTLRSCFQALARDGCVAWLQYHKHPPTLSCGLAPA